MYSRSVDWKTVLGAWGIECFPRVEGRRGGRKILTVGKTDPKIIFDSRKTSDQV
jgi:hypothetical protein